jgi:two-component system sensor histidine kinase/response regulator
MTEHQPVHLEPKRHPLPSTLVHDLRTPLNHIIGFSEILLESVDQTGYDNFAPDLRKILTAGKSLLSVLNDNLESVKDGASNGVAISDAEISRSAQISSDGSTEELPGKAPLASGTLRGFILVVDDDEGNRDVLSRRLESQGYSVDTAENGERALEMLRGDTFDLVLLDILMPGTDGFDVLKAIKAEKKLENIPVIMISALEEVDSVARCIEMGAEDYLSKPFDPVMLKARLGACLDKKRLRDREAFLFEELKQNYKRLQELERLRDDLTRMIIHDLRTPLTSLITGIQTIEAVGELSKDQKEVLQISLDGGGSLLGIINDLLDVEKLECGAMQLEYAEVSVSELISSAVCQVAALAEAKHLKLVQTIYDGLPLFAADEKKLVRTLVNLLGNAINFTPSGGQITVEANRADEERFMMFSVTDTGTGIPVEAFERIFEKFGQVQTRKSGQSGGTGLGLTFCKLAVEAHGGKIKVESSPEGSRFAFTIPLERPIDSLPVV